MNTETGHGRARTPRDGRRRAGFTLIEMLVVIVIILILMGVVFKMTRPAAGKDTASRGILARCSAVSTAAGIRVSADWTWL